MLDKIRTNLNLTIIFIFIVAFIYFLIATIIQSVSPNNIKEATGINQDTVAIYTSQDKIVRDYNTFFNAEKVIQSFITSLNEKKYQKVYTILSYDYQKKVDKQYFMKNIEKYVENNFKYNVENKYDTNEYINEKNLMQLYKVNKDEYVAVVRSTNASGKTNIGIKIVNINQYIITYIEL